jgi:putative transposase
MTSLLRLVRWLPKPVGELPSLHGGNPRDYAKWSALEYGFRPEEDADGEEETQARGDRRQVAPGRCLALAGQEVAEAIRSIGVTEVTYYRWRQEFGGLKSDQVKRLKDLETENSRLRRAIADLTLDKQILTEAARGNY